MKQERAVQTKPVQTTSPVLQRACACGKHTTNASGECEECKKKREAAQLQRSAIAPAPETAPPIVHDVLSSAGQPLDAETRAFMEPRFGHDFSQVRVHNDSRAAQSAQAVNALAYTVGNHVAFGAGRYQPSTNHGKQLLAHELAHVVQQAGSSHTNNTALPIAPEQSASEYQAEQSAQAVVQNQIPASNYRATAQVSRRGTLATPARPAVRPPTRAPARAPSRPSGGTSSPGRAQSDASGYQEPIWIPDQFDNSIDAMLQRGAIRDYAERQRIKAELPFATLARGGKAPKFITEQGTRTVTWLGGPAGGGSVTARVRRFHILDAIEHEVSQANNEADLHAILERYMPIVALLDDAISLSQGRTRLRTTQAPMQFLFDQPIIHDSIDPRAATRLKVFEEAVNKRAQQVPTLTASRLIPKSQRRKGCRIEPISPLGDDPMSVLYCHIATGSPYSYKITIEGADGKATQRWAEIDSLRGNTWYECKCGYEALLTGASRGQKVANAVLDKLDKQVLNHVDIARTCGLEYRYIVSNNTVADILRSRWFNNVVIDVVPFEGCD
jgi:hypothetical protein